MVIFFRLTFIIFIIVNLTACGGMIAARKGDTAFFAGNYHEAQKNYSESAAKKRTINKTIYLLSNATAQFWNHNFDDALKSLENAEQSNTSNRNPIISTMIAGDRLPYRMKDHELSFLHFFKSICYYFQNETEKALVELRKSIKAEPQSIFSELMLGLISAIELKDYNTGMVAMRRIISYNPDFLPAYDLQRLFYKHLGYEPESVEILNKLQSKQNNYSLLSDDPKNHYLLIFIDLPKAKKDIDYSKFMLQLYNDFKAQYKIAEARTNEQILDVIFKEITPAYTPLEPPRAELPLSATAIFNDMFVKSFNTNIPEQRMKDVLSNLITDLFKDIIKDEARKAATKDAKPMGWLIRGKDSLDPRYWNTLPGRLDALLLKLPVGEYNFTIKFYDSNNKYYTERELQSIKVSANKLNLEFLKIIR